MEEALAKDPLSLRRRVAVAAAFHPEASIEEVIATLRDLVARYPNQEGLLYTLAGVLARDGQHEESLAALRKMIPLMGDDSFADELDMMGYNFGRLGWADSARVVLDRLDALELEGIFVSPVIRASTHIGLGDLDRAFELYDQAVRDGDSWLVYLQNSPPARLLEDPRYDALLQRLGYSRLTYPR